MNQAAKAPESLQVLVEHLSAGAGASAASQKEELLKLAVLPRLLQLMEGQAADAEAAYAAAGCLACLVQHPKWLAEVSATGALTNKLLLLLSRQPALVPRLEPCLSTLLALLAEAGGPGWAGGRQLSTAAAGVLQALLEPSEYEPEPAKQLRRQSCLASGAVGMLLGQLQGASGPLLLSAAACLRFMALAPGAAEVLAGDPAVARQLLQLLSRGGDGVRAFVSGITWELAAAPLPAQQLLEAGAVPALLGVVQATAAAAGARSGKKGSKGKKKGDSSSKDGAAGKAGQQKEGSKEAAAGKAPEAGSQPASELLQDPAAAAAVALCNATGALHHLSFIDEAKQQLGQSPQLRLLVELLLRGKADSQTYDNLVGCLWNVGLLAENGPRLAAAGAPAHIVHPVPARWNCAAG
ncbi:hypothetical protein OEZ85_004754 [Tetradesmus obliquus]|uniref:Uncharacterized protein n=1 Tax=Tetradesmus obliquus TaxID=3088 RepID=A0ABY8UQ89_TETOB|nr:hypothetical protein OEZ85_004754 [Tetradesmus obliquus]